MKIIVPIPGAKRGGKRYAVEFDSDNIVKTNMAIGISESFDRKMSLVREPDGSSTLTLHFGKHEHRPMWVIIEEGHDGAIVGSRLADSDD